MNKKLSILLCIVLVLMTVLGGCGSANKNIRMGAGDIGGIYYSFSGAFAGIFNQDNRLKNRTEKHGRFGCQYSSFVRQIY